MLTTILKTEPRNILVINFGQLGDVILSLPAMKAIQDRFPDSRRSIVVGLACAEIVKMSGLFDEIISVDRVGLLHGNKAASSVRILKFAWEIRVKRFDLVIDLHSLPETNLLGYFSGAPTRLFANRESRSLDFLSNFRPKPPREDKSISLAENYLEILKSLQVVYERAEIELNPAKSDTDSIHKLLQPALADGRMLIGLNIGAGHPSRRWSLDSFQKLSGEMLMRGMTPIAIFGPEEEAIRREAPSTFPREAIVLPQLSIPQLTALFRRLSLLVTSDTGPMHLAAVAGTPLVLFLHENSPARFLPLTKDFEAIRYKRINEIKVSDVLEAIDKVRNRLDGSLHKGVSNAKTFL